MELVHFSNKIITKVRLRKKKEPSLNYKPHGFWVSDESEYGWSKWCKSEEFGLDRLQYPHSVELDISASVLHLGTIQAIDEFTDKYSKEMYPNSGIMGIDWDKVAKEYGGIIITPYQYQRRLNPKTHWYYGWDVASGCIWDTKIISKIELKK
jgi:hypothetical protein